MLICVAPRVDLPSPYISATLTTCSRSDQFRRRKDGCCGGSIVMNVFPNLSIVYFPGMCSIRLWHPKAPERPSSGHGRSSTGTRRRIKSSIRKQVTQIFRRPGCSSRTTWKCGCASANPCRPCHRRSGSATSLAQVKRVRPGPIPEKRHRCSPTRRRLPIISAGLNSSGMVMARRPVKSTDCSTTRLTCSIRSLFEEWLELLAADVRYWAPVRAELPLEQEKEQEPEPTCCCSTKPRRA